MIMREKAARTLCLRLGNDPDVKGYGTDQDGNRCDPFLWEMFLPHVDAVIDALANPNDAVVLAGLGMQRLVGPLTEPSEMRKTWNSMIRAIKEGK
jgi:hypothetical protein